jgi:hypothetical protein
MLKFFQFTIAGAVVLFVAFMFIGSDKQPAEHIYAGERGVFKFTAPACKTEDEFTKLHRLIIAEDKAAQSAFLLSRVASGECRMVPEGTIAAPEPLLRFSDNFCVRPLGQVECLWTNKGWLKKQL